MVTQNYTISTVKTATPPKVKMSQYDYGMRTITFAVVDGSGAAVDLTGKTVTVEGTRIDGHAFVSECTVSGATATFTETVDMTNQAGDHPAELVVRENGQRLGTMNFIISVEPAAMDEDASITEEDQSLFNQLYEKLAAGSPATAATVAEMTDTDAVYLYTGSETGYTAGDWYYYDGVAWVSGGVYGGSNFDADGTYPDLTAGQLYTDEGVENVEPYFFRAVPVAAREARMRKLVGGTVGWNQLCNGESATVTNGRKYYLSKGGTESIGSSTGAAITGLTSGTDMVIDLTLALGSTTADYIYSLETATTGAGVAFFRKYFPEAYYEYNAGELKSVEGVSEKVTVGFNQFEPPTSGTKHGITFTSVDGKVTASGTPTSSNNYHLGTVKLIAGQTYYFSGCPSGGGSGKYGIRIYNSVDSTLLTADYGSGATYTPDADVEVIVAIAYWYNYSLNLVFAPCVNISDPSRNGTFEQYVSHTYPLDSTLTLRGIPKLADGKMYFDGDEYASDGTVTRKYGVVDLGTLMWTYNSSGSFFQSTNIASGSAHPANNTTVASIKCAQYATSAVGPQPQANSTVSMTNGGTLRVVDSRYTDAASFKTAMSGVYLVYELATPTTETADPFTESQICDPYGTEEFISTGLVPVGHDTLYVDDLRQRLEDIAPPTTDGTYTLQVTVSGGRPTFSWVTANRSLSMGNPFASAAEDETTEETEETTEETEEPVEEGDQR